MKEVTTSELKAQLDKLKLQLNRIESKIDLKSSPVDELVNLPSDDLVEWIKDNPYEVYETGFDKLKPITYGMRKRMEKARYGKVVKLTSYERSILRKLTEKNPEYGNRPNCDMYFSSQGEVINEIMKKLYNVE